jgi:hypothetical protein
MKIASGRAATPFQPVPNPEMSTASIPSRKKEKNPGKTARFSHQRSNT